ncbi:DAO-domain-containing protein [Ophiobolus disseminans]|uniref:DAO-domain-containing protein n=1 Tax=Ophiobolus disseminans TaxID=1469910 RepID=A0A6A6ZZF6_9PLEO|nr:DAO-domain-containing protein [Ophiobolus disseminans]
MATKHTHHYLPAQLQWSSVESSFLSLPIPPSHNHPHQPPPFLKLQPPKSYPSPTPYPPTGSANPTNTPIYAPHPTSLNNVPSCIHSASTILTSPGDIAIIGSGLSGMLTLYHILSTAPAHSRPNVMLFEARELCSGATARNGGHAKVKIATLVGKESGGERDKMQAYVAGVIQELERIVVAEGLGEECEFEVRRSLDVFLHEGECEKMKGVYDAAILKGEYWARNIDFVGADEAEKASGVKGAVGAFICPAASFWPYKLATGILEVLIRRFPEHINVQTNTLVTSLEHGILHTPRGALHSEKIVLATNAWTAGLVPSFNGTITPVKGMACHIAPSHPHPVFPHLKTTYNIYFPPGADYLNPRPDGSIVVGGGAWLFPSKDSWYNNFNDAQRFASDVENHWRDGYMQNTFLGWEDSGAGPDSVWVGIMGSTDDGMPHVGRVPEDEYKGVWMLAGFNGGGMALIATAAKAVAKMVLEDLGFEDVKDEFGLLEGMGTSGRRLNKDGRGGVE